MDYEAIIIGGGPGGYVAAIRMGQLGLKTALVEKERVGGVCLNRGCIPTKALYAATGLIERAGKAGDFGIDFPRPKIDLPRLIAWKDGIVARLVTGVEKLLAANGVTLIKAEAEPLGSGKVSLSSGDEITGERIVLALGSAPVEIPGFSFSDPIVWSSTDALNPDSIPEQLVVIGGGVIGLELATVYSRLGTAVTVLELMDEILPGLDIDRRAIARVKAGLKAAGIDIRTGTAAAGYEKDGEVAVVKTKEGERFRADRILLAVGRRPNSAGLAELGIELDRRGFVMVDENLATSVPGIYAIGDLTPGPMLAHKASAEGVKLAARFAKEDYPLDYDKIPQAIFTSPELASVGLSEKRAKEEGYEILVGRFPYAGLGKALGMNEPDGFFQIVADAKTKRILGAQIVGAEASDLISEAAVAVQNGLTLEAIADPVHPHPTLPEGLKEAAENALGRAIHAVNR
ncbi:dihydrolipoyl dehydrogenase [Candidatus Acetothermia bacterium]|nr:MAG: dihydrolipoyl dehydrogenase [Candidatus Acetothermia bacterium]